jgi:glyoxylase-like metal-dependent hydrolase (beta-lactamase superfamily II)
VRIRCLTTGRVRPKRRSRGLRRYLPGDWSDETLPVHAFAVEHPAGVCLFDTGQTARAARGRYHPWWHPYLRLSRFELEPEDEASAQLAPETVRWVVLSHLHTDHVGGLAWFAHADVFVSRIEWERSLGLRGRLRGYLPQHWPTGLVPRLIEFGGPALGPFTGSFDVAGDGSLLVVPTRGHTPGHISLLVELRTLLGGDMAHHARELSRSASHVAAWCEREGVTVLLAHDDGVKGGE